MNLHWRLRKLEKRLDEAATKPSEQRGHYVQLLRGRLERLLEHAEPGDPIVERVVASLKEVVARRDDPEYVRGHGAGLTPGE